MLSRAAFRQHQRAAFALSYRGILKTASRLPYWLLHRLIVTWIRGETWLRFPLWTLNVRDSMEEAFDELDPDGTHMGLTPEARDRYRRNFFYNEIADLLTIFLYIDQKRFRRKALRVENREALLRELKAGPGAIVAGFRVGSYAGLPWAIGTLGVPVLMIVGDADFARMARDLGRSFAPRSTGPLTFIRAKDPLVLARSQAVLKDGGIVCTLIDLSPLEYEKTARVQIFDTPLNVAYGLPYLAAVTGRSIVPVALTRAAGPRFTLRFSDSLPPPARDSAAVREGTQRLYDELEQVVRRFPDQWIGWQTLHAAARGNDAEPGALATASLT